MVTRAPRWKAVAAFSLIELLVVVSIFAFISTLVLANHSKFNSSVLLESLAYDTALSIRQAQVYGLSVRQSSPGSTFQVGYGIHFTKNTPTSYLFFADNNMDKKYDAAPVPADSIVDTYAIGQGHTILRFCAYTASGTADCSDSSTPITYLDISFFRPEPDANFATSKTGTLYSRASITVTSGSAETRTISVASTGEVSVANP